jgi:hypothetical protein
MEGRFKMPILNWALICADNAETPEGLPVLIGVVDHMTAEALPVSIDRFVVASQWEGDNGEEFTYDIRILSPSGKDCIQPIEDIFKIEKIHCYIVSSIINVSFFEEGKHLIRLIANRELVHSISFYVDIA